jgi:hypothetical protein
VTWLTWRLQRTELALLGVVLIVLATLLLLTYSDVVAEYEASASPECVTGEGFMLSQCFADTSNLYKVVTGLLPFFNFLPLLAAILVALPIVSELESGSYRLAWTQSITRGRWARFKYGGTIMAALLFAGVFAASFHWWSAPMNRLNGRLNGDEYDFLGLLPVAHTLFAVGLMLAIGTVTRKPVLSIALATVAYIAIRVPFMVALRERLVSPIEEATRPFTSGPWSTGYVVDVYWRDPSGARLSDRAFENLCLRGLPDENALQQCIDANGLVHYTLYHPESHFWPLQLVESGIFAGAAIACIGFSAWYVLRRIE